MWSVISCLCGTAVIYLVVAGGVARARREGYGTDMAYLVPHEDGWTLEDLVREGLDVLFVGFNPNPLAIEREHYYARSTNRFWEDLHEAGFVPRVLRGPHEDRRVLEFGVGLTDVVKRPTATSDQLTAADYRAGFARLALLVERQRPRLVCFNGLGLLARYRKLAPWPGVEVTAVPSTSPRNQGLRSQRLEAFRALYRRLHPGEPG